jgi:hypothetical protein
VAACADSTGALDGRDLGAGYSSGVRGGVALVLISAAIAGGCGSSGGTGEAEPGTDARTVEALWRQPGEDVGLVNGTADFAPGEIRLSFLVVDGEGRPISRPRARVWVAGGLRAKPFEETEAALEDVGIPGASSPAAGDVTKIYVARLRLPKPGTYWVLAEPVGGRPIQALGNVVVRPRTKSPPVGAPAPRSRTPTLASEPDLSKLTTSDPPDRELLRHSIAESLAARAPFVVAFATPQFCTSRTCGPVVDVVERVRRDFADSGIRFIHVEVYRDNDPAKGLNRWMREWSLPSEPWVFLVGRDGRIKAKFEGSVSVAELRAAVQRQLA